MNKTISLAAIGMVAVVMGLSAFAPAMADNGSNGQKTTMCHIQVEVKNDLGETLEEASVSIINVNDRSVDDHLAHDNDGSGSADGDFVIDGTEGQTEGDCPVTEDEEEEEIEIEVD